MCWTFTPAHVDYAAFIASLVPEFASSMSCFPQQGADLGERLLYAFQWTHAYGYRNSILIGSDSPHISRNIIADARTALNEVAVVLGPSDDGGYYLIAMHQPHDVFSGIPMSTSVVTQRTIEQAERLGLTVQCIHPLFDIDELPDLLRLAKLLGTDSQLAPATAAYITSTRTYMTTTSIANLPRSIYIEPTSRCNEFCQQCPRTLLSREDDRDLSFDKFRYIVDQFPVLERVVLHGLGEPLLNKELPRMVRYLKDRGTSCSTPMVLPSPLNVVRR